MWQEIECTNKLILLIQLEQMKNSIIVLEDKLTNFLGPLLYWLQNAVQGVVTEVKLVEMRLKKS